MDELIEILEDINPDVDYMVSTGLIKEKNLTSLDLAVLIGEISRVFDVTVPAHKITPENFNSAQSIYALIQELDEDD